MEVFNSNYIKAKFSLSIVVKMADRILDSMTRDFHGYHLGIREETKFWAIGTFLTHWGP